MIDTALGTESVSFIRALLREKTAINLDASKGYLIEARLAPIAQQFGFDSTSCMVHDIRTNPTRVLVDCVTEAMTTNETSFFRDAHPFAALRDVVLPEFMKRNRANRTLNIWSAASSTGQELYSIAITMRDHFPELRDWNVGLLGTDLSDDVLSKARIGKYSDVEVSRGLSIEQLDTHFLRERSGWKLCSDTRNLASFERLNLIAPWPILPLMDVVFLRNVLIYFVPEVKKFVLEKIRKVMAPHAVLILGATESTFNLNSSFQRVQVGQNVHYRLKS